MRQLGVMMKFSPLEDTLRGKKIVVVDDSIVRGTTTGKLVQLLKDAGAAEVHIRITAPPVKHPCFYGIDMAKEEELVAFRHTVEEIRTMIGADSLSYLSIEGAVGAVQQDKDKFCRACFDGIYPIAIPKDVAVTKMALEKAA